MWQTDSTIPERTLGGTIGLKYGQHEEDNTDSPWPFPVYFSGGNGLEETKV